MKPEQLADGVWLYEGDCLDVLPRLEAGSVDAVVTDPPYGIQFAAQPTKWQRLAGAKPHGWDDAPADVSRLLKLAPVVCIWGGNYFPLPPSRGWLIWTKPDAPPSMGSVEMAWTNRDANSRNIQHSISSTNAERCGHPTQKPLAVMRWCLKQLRLQPNSLILDCYAGSGTTGIAAYLEGHRCILIEKDARYCQIIRERVRKADGRAPGTLFAATVPTLFDATEGSVSA